MSTSVEYSVDTAIRVLLFDKFSDIMGFEIANIYKDIIQWPMEVALRERSEKAGHDHLEFMNFWRSSTSPSWSRQRTVLARRGLWLERDGGSAIHIKAQPMDLSYNVWVWSKSLDTVYQCVERYMLWQNNYPKIGLEYVVDDDHSYEYTPDLHFGEVVDESTFGERYQKGIAVIYKFPIKVDAWAFDSTPPGSVIINKIRMTIYDKDSLTEYSEVVVDDSSQDEELADRLRMSRRYLYGISSVDLLGNSVTIPNDRTSDFSVGDMVTIEGSTYNDESYSIVSATLSGSNTVLVLGRKNLVSSTADGIIGKISSV